jgi:hypothetical protein
MIPAETAFHRINPEGSEVVLSGTDSSQRRPETGDATRFISPSAAFTLDSRADFQLIM